MDITEARRALKSGSDVRRASWKVGRYLRFACGVVFPVEVDLFGHRRELRDQAVAFSWEEIDAQDWEVAAPEPAATSICDHQIWDVVRPYFGERPHELRGLEVRKLPKPMSIRLQQLELPCCTCGRSIAVFRRRQGADWSDLYYSPACPSAVSPGCSRGAECRDEVDRIRSYLRGNPIQKPQLGLF